MYGGSVLETHIVERFISRAVESGDCLVFTREVDSDGYGVFRQMRSKVKFRAKAHRAVWEFYNGPIPDGMVVRHTCDNPPCIQREHLVLGKQEDNMKDMGKRGRWRNQFTHGPNWMPSLMPEDMES